MSARSNKVKGRNFQQEVRDFILKHFPSLEADDVRSNPMGAPGEDILLSPAARKVLGGIQIECKKSKKISLMRWYEQAKEHGTHTPTVWCKEDGRGKPMLVTIPADWFIELLKRGLIK